MIGREAAFGRGAAQARSASADASHARRFAGLDLIRFAAAAAVMLFHLTYWSWKSPVDTAYRASRGLASFPELVPLTWFGWVGVEVFFVLSGVVIAYSASGRRAWPFMRGRIGRLMPVMWLCIALSIVATISLGLETPARLIHLTVNSLILWPYGPWLDGVYWTLPVEIVFYGFVWIVLALRDFRHVERWAAALGLASASFWLAQSFGAMPVGNTIATYLLLRHGCFFSLGVFLWLVAERGIAWRRVAPLLIAAVAGLIEIGDTAHARVPDGLPAWTPAFFWLAMVALMYGSLRYARLLPTSPANWTRRVGLMTYPLYLLHGLIGCGVLRSAPFVGRWAALGLAIAASLIASYLAVSIEPAIRRRLYRVLDAMSERFARLAGRRI